MSKMSDMATTIEELRNAAATITDVANWLTELFSTTTAVDETQESEPVSPPEPVLTLEQVRAVLADPRSAPKVRRSQAVRHRPCTLQGTGCRCGGVGRWQLNTRFCPHPHPNGG